MRICIVNKSKIPVRFYGGTERDIWYLGRELSKLGHEVIYLVGKGSYSDFAEVNFLNPDLPVPKQIPENVDIVHYHYTPEYVQDTPVPYLVTIHGNQHYGEENDINTNFISRNHAERHGSDCFVYNGMDWDDYSDPDLNMRRKYFHFLGKAAWRVKNVSGAIDAVLRTRWERLVVMGGYRFNFKMGMRFTLSPRIRFTGMVGGTRKDGLLNGSKGLIFPVRWHEPQGLAIIESLYFGCPVFGTPYGSLAELIKPEVGFLTTKSRELSMALENYEQYSPKTCHEYAVEQFNSKKMTEGYLKLYERVLAGESLNENPPGLREIQKEKLLTWER